MGSIVCFGDSNTWGCAPIALNEPLRRLRRNERWPGILAANLDSTQYEVVEEGLSGRTTVFDDPIEGQHKNAMRTIVALLESHDPIDLIILMLGTNDFKPYFSATAYHSARGMSTVVQEIKTSYLWYHSSQPELLIVAPPYITSVAPREFWEDAAERCRPLTGYLEQVADRSGAFFIDANRYCKTGSDGVHMDPYSHQALAAAITEKSKAILKLRA